MSDFKTIARILGAIRSCEGRPFDVATVSPEALGVDERQRDVLAVKLQNAGKISGLMTAEDVGNAPLTVLWGQSRPEVTLDGSSTWPSASRSGRLRGLLPAHAGMIPHRSLRHR